MSRWLLVIIILNVKLFSTAQFSPQMTQEQEDAQEILELYEEYKAIVAMFKSGNLKQACTAEDIQGVKEMKEFLREHVPKARMVMNRVTSSTSQEDIGCSPFVSAVTKWRKNTVKFFKSTRTSYAKVNISTKSFVEELLYEGNLPLISALYQEWEVLLTSLPDSVRGLDLFTVLLDNKGSAWQLAADVSGLEKHYKSNRKAYKRYESTMESFRDEEMPKEKYFLDALGASSSLEDPNLPENLADAEAKGEKWGDIYRIWLNETIGELNDKDTSTTGKRIDKVLLKSQMKGNTGAPDYAQGFWQEVRHKILRAIESEAAPVLYDRATVLAIQVVDAETKIFVTKDFLKKASQSGDTKMPYGLQDWLEASIEGQEISIEHFEAQYRIWSRAVSNAVALCENQLKGRDFRLDRAKLSKELKSKLNYRINGASPGLEVLQELEKALPKGKTLSFDDLVQGWQDGVNAVQTDAFIENLWEQYIVGTTQMSVTEASSSFMNSLPSVEAFVNALFASRYHSTKQKTPVPKDTLYAYFEVLDEKSKSYKFAFPLPLKLIQGHLDNGTKLYYASIDKVKMQKISIDDVINRGGKGYKIDTLKSVEVLSTQVQNSGKEIKASTWVNFRLGVTDSSLTTVMQEARKGSLGLVSINLEDVLGLKKKSGVNLFNGATAGIELKVVGGNQGGLGEVQASGMLVGYKVTFHMGKEGWYVKVKSPLDFQEALKRHTEGETNYDITFKVKVESVSNSLEHVVYAIEGDKGKISIEGSREQTTERVQGRESLEVNSPTTNIKIPLK